MIYIVIKEAVAVEGRGFTLTGRTILLDDKAPYFDALPDGGVTVRKQGWMAVEADEYQALSAIIHEAEENDTD